MKKLLILLLILSFTFMLISCGGNSGEEANDTNDSNQEVNSEVIDAKYTINGSVMNIESEAIYINALDTSNASGAYLVKISKGTIFYDESGKVIDLTQISKGDEVEIGYNGQVTKSLPPQITAIKIQKI